MCSLKESFTKSKEESDDEDVCFLSREDLISEGDENREAERMKTL